MEGWIFFHQALQGDAELVLVGLGVWLDGQLDDRGREGDMLQGHGPVGIVQRLAGGRRLEAQDGANITRPDDVHFLATVGMHPHQPPDALLIAVGGIDQGFAAADGTRVDAKIGQPPHVRVGADLEDQRRRRFFRIGRTEDGCAAIGVNALHGRHIQGRRQVVDDGVQ